MEVNFIAAFGGLKIIKVNNLLIKEEKVPFSN